MEQTDIQLVIGLREGDSVAFERLYRRHRDGVYGYCFRMLRQRTASEDAVQETFLRVLNSSHTLRDTQAFLPWLYRIAHNCVLMSLRVRPTDPLEEARDIPSAESPFETAVANERTASLQEHLAALRPEYREALLLREFQHMTYAEIASATDSTESAVKSRIFKARKALAGRLRTLAE